jgi:hypothetical protein
MDARKEMLLILTKEYTVHNCRFGQNWLYSVLLMHTKILLKFPKINIYV